MAHIFTCPCRSAARCLLAALLLLGALPAMAGIDVELEGIEADLRRNVLIYLSVERYRDRDDVDEDTMQRLFNRIDGEVKGALRPFGYYEPEVGATFRPASGGWRVSIVVAPGEAVRLRELAVDIEGPGAADPVFDGIRGQTELRIGTRLHHGDYEKLKNSMTNVAAANGYLAARLLDNVMYVDEQARSASITLRLDTGPQYHFGKVDIDQNVVRPALMQRFVRFREGETYNRSQLLATQFALDDSLYFSRVDVTTGDPDPETLTVPVSITAAKSRPVLSLGGGYGTDTGVRGTLGWTDSRVNDRGHRLRFELRASRSTRRVESRYDIPIGDPALEKFSVEALNRLEKRPEFDTNETTLRPSVTRVHGRWQTVTSLSATRTTTDDGIDQFTSNLLVPGLVLASLPEGFLGEALFSRGFYSELLASRTELGASTDFLRMMVQLERGFDLSSVWHLLLRGEIGATLVDDFSRLDGIYRFTAGGDRSVRGFGYQSLAPEGGGRHLLTGSVEVVRDIPWNLAVATFFDAGNAFNKFGDKLEFAAGVGLRYRLPVVSIGMDL
ncbi:MAG TPA: POTRA domain-containing protein, partial [Steroidobacteraceae bacterium]|nr:POTRA domain-containing protein [Steroidobacteraceae bacterium]